MPAKVRIMPSGEVIPIREEGSLPYAYIGWAYNGNDFIPYEVPGDGSGVSLFNIFDTYPDGAFAFSSDTTVFEPYPQNGEMFCPPMQDGITGLFHARGFVSWDGTPPLEFDYSVGWQGAAGVAGDDAAARNPMLGDGSGQAAFDAIFTTIPFGEGSAMTCSLAQSSGSPKGIIRIGFYVVRLNTYDFVSGNFYPPFPGWP